VLPLKGTIVTSTQNLRVTGIESLPLPRELREEHPLSDEQSALVETSRAEIEAVLSGRDDRLVVVVGPCSVHDPVAALVFCAPGEVALSVIDGRVVVKDGRLATLDLPVLIERHNRLARELVDGPG